MLKSIGLGGDGDEVAAIERVESAFSVKFDDTEASEWRTAGDVFGSLARALEADGRSTDGAWPIFCKLICEETGANPDLVGPETLLLGRPLFEVLGDGLQNGLIVALSRYQ